ncbi:YciI family protein [Streptomyces sp. NPDC026672]|uniref:YciI family protein n=1 Tax=unclassified Streptomyces TaxID=2593676 RepID=UPI0033F44FE7
MSTPDNRQPHPATAGGERGAYYVVTYRWDPASEPRLRTVYPSHRAHVDQLGAAGGLWLTGVLTDLVPEHSGEPRARTAVAAQVPHGALAVFRDRATAERFIHDDPYVDHGLITISAVQIWQPLIYPL